MKSIQKSETVIVLVIALLISAICLSAWSFGTTYAKASQSRPLIFGLGK